MALLPDVTDEDVRAAALLLKLPEAAFAGSAGTDPRAEVLKTNAPIDVAACPGSGKTTLLVAKLAILASKWQSATQGICVLSHTNAARREIEGRLGHSVVGRRLLGYPHFIGTIHGFVDAFLAIPWLRSQGFPIRLVDTERVCRRRWSRLQEGSKSGLERQKAKASVLVAKKTDFTVGKVRWGKGELGEDRPVYRDIQRVCRDSALEGDFCYEEMFMWANDFLDKCPQAVEILRGRFPILFLDEAQDNSEEQSAILHRIFIRGQSPIIRQRFGDDNQAIYDSSGSTGASTDPFPDVKNVRDLPSSHRFGPNIAKLADPFGVVPQGLQGLGPAKPLSGGAAEGCHTLFVFDDEGMGKVLERFGDLLVATFSQEELNVGTFVAVGQVHKANENDRAPRHTGHYWPEYNPALARLDPRPNTLVDYIRVGQARATAAGEVGVAVETMGAGILSLARMLDSRNPVGHPRHIHRFLLERLGLTEDLKTAYLSLVDSVAIKCQPMTAELWHGRWKEVLARVGEAVGGDPIASGGQEAQSFLSWSVDEGQGTGAVPVKSPDNVFRYAKDGKQVGIRMGSIHSVKGETHTATLVLETFYRRHNLQALMPWVIGESSGVREERPEQSRRLRLHYVAVSRPTHLLCLAMRKESFCDDSGQLIQDKIDRATRHGWAVVFV